jgi:hypothetical protein
MATVEQIATIRARLIDDTAREMMLTGVSLTWAEAEAVGDEACDWIARRLGLAKMSDDRGVHFERAVKVKYVRSAEDVGFVSECSCAHGTRVEARTMRPWPIALRSDEMTEASEHVFQDAGSWWFETEDESSMGPFPSVDAADDAFKAYCRDVLGAKE